MTRSMTASRGSWSVRLAATSVSATRVEAPNRTLTWALAPDRDLLERRIRSRLGTMMAQGFVEEVEGLRARHGADLPLLGTLGYREIGR